MPLKDIGLVTSTIARLVEQVIIARGDMGGDPLVVNAAPPEDQTNEPNIISFHLFHVVEDAYRKNLAPVPYRSSAVPVQLSPMGLMLNYVVTARNTTATDSSGQALAEQRMLGFVARALHDFPVITDETIIAPNPPVMPAALQGDGNTIQLIFRPVTIDEVVNFWSAEQDLTARFSLFYEARVVLLDTPAPPPAPGIVLSMGNYAFASGSPRLACTRNVVGFIPPAGFGPTNPAAPFERLPATPARASLFPGGAVPPTVHEDNDHLVLEGEGFASPRSLLSVRGPAEIDADPYGIRRYRLPLNNPAINSPWNLDLTDTKIELDVRTTAQDDLGRSVTLFPGFHRVSVVTTREPPGSTTGRLFENSSNELAFSVAPQIVTVAPTGGPPNARVFAITLFGSYLSADLEVELTVGGRVFPRDAALPEGTFDFTDGTGQIDFVVDTTVEASPLPVRLQINGAEATPAWAEF